MRYFSNSLTITELSKSKETVESTGLALLSKYILQIIGHFNREDGVDNVTGQQDDYAVMVKTCCHFGL
jgi:hypothetical protein